MLREVQSKRKRTQSKSPRRRTGGIGGFRFDSPPKEFKVLEAARDAGVTVATPIAYFPDVMGKEAFISKRLHGEAVGRRVVSRPEFANTRASLPLRLAEELAKIHSLDLEQLEFLPGTRDLNAAEYLIERLRNELDATLEPHPVIELALLWLSRTIPVQTDTAVLHGDFRIGNLMIADSELIGVLDWEFAHVGDPTEDLAWTLIRAWRFGNDQLHLGGIGPGTAFLSLGTSGVYFVADAAFSPNPARAVHAFCHAFPATWPR